MTARAAVNAGCCASVALDPAYARAHIELGSAYGTKADYLSMPELNLRSLASLRRAIELQPGSARAWRELGGTLMAVGEDLEGMAALRRALVPSTYSIPIPPEPIRSRIR